MMDSEEQGEAFKEDLTARIQQFREEYDLKLGDIIAALGLIIYELSQETETLADLEDDLNSEDSD